MRSTDGVALRAVWISERRIRNAGVRPADVTLDRECILSGTDIAAVDTLQAERFQMPDQVAFAAAQLGESLDAVTTQVRYQRRHRFERSRIEIGLATFEAKYVFPFIVPLSKRNRIVHFARRHQWSASFGRRDALHFV